MSASPSTSESFEVVEKPEAEKGPEEAPTQISPLWEALHRNKDFDAVNKILADGHDVNERWSASAFARLRHPGGCVVPSWDPEEDECVTAPVFGAVYSLQTRFVDLLVRYGANIEARNKAGRTPLHEAVRLDSDEMVGALLKCGADIESRVIGAWLTDCSALHLAALDVRPKMIQCLIGNGADAKSTLQPGWSALDIAILDRQQSPVVALLEAGGGAQAILDRLHHTTAKSAPGNGASREQTARQLIHKGVLETTGDHVELYKECVAAVSRRLRGDDRSNVALASELILQTEKELLEVAGDPNRITWDMKLCDNCSKFQLLDGSAQDEEFRHSDTLQDLVASAEMGCAMCIVILEHLKKLGTSFHEYSKKPSTEAVDPVSLALRQSYTNGSLAAWCGDLKAWIPLARVDVHANAAVAATEPDDRFGMGSTRSFATARAWLRACVESHETCRPSKQAGLPERVLYVGDELTTPYLRVTHGEQQPYATLGHCWGLEHEMRTTDATFSQSCKGIAMADFPPAIKDAITITRQLGIKNLWIAALCIVQESPLDFWQASAAMSDVYAHATVSIMAQDIESSKEPLLKTRDWRTSALVPLDVRLPTGTKQWGGFYYPRRTSPMSRLLLAGQSVGYHNAPKGDESALSSRVWTLQEELLSCRTLHCWKAEFSWSCNEKVGSEREHDLWRRPTDWQDGVKRALSVGRDRSGEALTPSDLFGYWKEIIDQSFQRKADFPSDRFASIAGMLTRIEDLLHEKSVAGVLQGQHFWPSLCWRPETPTSETQVRDPCPSWSWLSAPGRIDWIYRGDESFHPEVLAWNVQRTVQSTFEGSITVRCTLWRRLVRPDAQPVDVPKRDDADAPVDDDEDMTAEDLEELRAMIQARWPGLSAEIEDDTAHYCVSYSGDESQASGDQRGELPVYVTNVILDRRCDENISQLWYIPVATVPFQSPPKYGYPMYPEGLRSYISLLCLDRLPGIGLRFRRVGWARAYERAKESLTPRRDKPVEFVPAPCDIELF